MSLEPSQSKQVERVRRCFDDNARLTRWPAKRSDQIVVVWVVWSFIPLGTQFSEAEVNAMLRGWHDYEDYALLRRELCDMDLMRRTPTGSVYRRVEHEMPAEAAAVLELLVAE